MSQFCPNLKCKRDNADHSILCAYCASPLIGLLGDGSILTGSKHKKHYVIQALLGRGGMGAVYLAHQQGKETTPLAIKENILYIDDSTRNQFEREASVLMGLDHPNLPKVSDHFFETSGKQYLVMEYVDGDDLQQWLRKHKTVPEDKALAWADELLSTLTYLHTRPKTILHRDIKPSNIKITPQGKLVLIDFGLVKLYGGDHTSVLSSQRGFTPNYAPPEQANGNERPDPSSDLYAVGGMLYYWKLL